MVTVRGPRGALEATVMTATTLVVADTPEKFSVIPVPENVSRAPFWKPLPFTVNTRSRPRRSEVGVTEVILGAAVTEKPLARVATRPSGAVTVTVRAPSVAVAATVMTAVTRDALFTVNELTVIPAPKAALSPVPNPEP